MDFYTAYTFLSTHPKGRFIDALDFDLAMVNPLTHEIDRDPEKNTELEVWLETGPEVGIHDMMLDCGGPSFEAALIKLAGLVEQYYGDDRLDEWDEFLFYVHKCR